MYGKVDGDLVIQKASVSLQESEHVAIMSPFLEHNSRNAASQNVM